MIKKINKCTLTEKFALHLLSYEKGSAAPLLPMPLDKDLGYSFGCNLTGRLSYLHSSVKKPCDKLEKENIVNS